MIISHSIDWSIDSIPSIAHRIHLNHQSNPPLPPAQRRRGRCGHERERLGRRRRAAGHRDRRCHTAQGPHPSLSRLVPFSGGCGGVFRDEMVAWVCWKRATLFFLLARAAFDPSLWDPPLLMGSTMMTCVQPPSTMVATLDPAHVCIGVEGGKTNPSKTHGVRPNDPPQLPGVIPSSC